MGARIKLHDRILVIKLMRLGRTPPALYSTEILAEEGFPVTVVEYGLAHETESRPLGKFTRHRLQNRWAHFVPRQLRASFIWVGTLVQLIYCLLRSGRCRYIIAHGISEQTLAYALNRLFKIPYTVHVHEFFEAGELTWLNRFFHAMTGPALRGASILTFPEKTRAELTVKAYKLSNPSYLIYNCPRKLESVEARDLRKELGLPEDCMTLGYFGGLGPENQLEEGIRAVGRIKRLHFLIWGWGSRYHIKKLKKLARGLGISHRVHILGELSEPRWPWIAGLDLAYCVYAPKLARLRFAATASNKLMEAISVGVPVITSDQPDFAAFLKDFEVGQMANPQSVESISAAFRKFVDDPEGRNSKSKAARLAHLDTLNFEFQFAPLLSRYRSTGLATKAVESEEASRVAPSVLIPRG